MYYRSRAWDDALSSYIIFGELVVKYQHLSSAIHGCGGIIYKGASAVSGGRGAIEERWRCVASAVSIMSYVKTRTF